MANKKTIWIFIFIVMIFLALRLPGLDVPYHQDEWKNISAASSMESAGKFFAHPPLQQMFFVVGYKIFGENNMRLSFLIFGGLTVLMLYLVIRRRTDATSAIWTTVLFAICFYSVLGSLMTDVDGSILPFFFLVAVYAYDRFIDSHSAFSLYRWRWFTLLVITLLLGLLVKLSFVLAVGAIILDYIWNSRRDLGIWRKADHNRRDSLKKLGVGILGIIGFGAGYIFLLYVIEKIYPAFNIGLMLGHAGQFSEGDGRNWIQIAVQGLKAIFYLSPLLILPLVFGTKEIFKKTRIFWTYLILGCLFYFVLFDFSRGALDKYLMFAIVPLSIVSGMIIAEFFSVKRAPQYWRWPVIISILLCGLLFTIQFLPHEVIPLYPKTLWFSRVLQGDWFILNPFNGGSGPLGFYVSFMFIASSFVVSAVLIIAGFFRREWKAGALFVVVCVGLTYNVVFAQEFLFGKINGSAPQVLEDSIRYIRSNQEIAKVLTYNDTGAQKLVNAGVYAGRFYAAPQFEEGHRARFAENVSLGGHFLVIGIPPFYQGFYSDFFSKCDILFETRSGVIVARVYSCIPARQ